MIFIALLALTTTAVAAAAAFFSVYGLAHTFSGAFWSVVFMGGSIEAGKLVLLSFLYRFKDSVGWKIKFPAVILTLCVMLLTSLGIYGYLSSAYQTDTLDMKQIAASVELKTQEQVKLQQRKDDIDKQISQLPTKDVKGRQRLMKQFGPEIDQVNTRLTALTAELQQLSQDQIKVSSHVGPIVFIAKAIGMDPDSATNILILLIVFVFDPLAIFLTIATNIAIKHHRDSKLQVDSTVPDKDTSVPVGIVEEPVIPAVIEDLPVINTDITPPEMDKLIEPSDDWLIGIKNESLDDMEDDHEMLEDDTTTDIIDEVKEVEEPTKVEEVAEISDPKDELAHLYQHLFNQREPSDEDISDMKQIESFYAKKDLITKIRTGQV